MLKWFEKVPVEKWVEIAFIFFGTLVVMKVAARFVRLYAQKRKDVFQSTSIFTNLVEVVVFIVGFLMVLQALGISIAPLLAAMGVGGLAVALGLQPTLANLFSGIQILLSGQIKTGDYVKLDTGEEGYVHDITWRNTTIHSLPDNIVIIPNSKMSTAVITNFSRPKKALCVSVSVGVAYESDLEKVEKVTLAVAREVVHELVPDVSGFEPTVRFNTFADSSINFTVSLKAKEFADQYLVKHVFIKRLKERFDKEGIDIPFPQRVVHTSKGIPIPSSK